jgi:prepilin-type N-terminal cleavage/methylation domain-containing protein
MRSSSSFILHPASFRRSAFTLIELLVVVGIIVVLITLLVPVITGAIRGGDRARLNAHMQAIATALEAYKTDFNAYPVTSFDVLPSRAPAASVPNDSSSWDNQINADGLRGARVLAKALVGPQDAVYLATRNPANVAPRTDEDGADGPGFRIADRSGQLPARSTSFVPVALGEERGKVYGPYLTGAFGKVSNSDSAGALVSGARFDDSAVLVDALGKPVLYFPQTVANLRNVGIDNASNTDGLGGLICDTSANMSGGLYDINDNKAFISTDGALAIRNLGRVLGDRNNDNSTLTSGHIAAGEAMKPTPAPYLLWFAGPDQTFGSPSGAEDNVAQTKIDDVTNIAP